MYHEKHICDRCENQIATVHLKQIFNGKESQRHLCSACAAKEGIGASAVTGFSWESDPFDELLGSFFLPHAPASVTRCPTCNQSLADLKRTGRFGCSDCYETFENRVDLRPFSSPKGYRGKGVLKSPASEKKQSAPNAASLKEQLKKAVEQEDYESAAKLRDQIRALENKEGQ